MTEEAPLKRALLTEEASLKRALWKAEPFEARSVETLRRSEISLEANVRSSMPATTAAVAGRTRCCCGPQPLPLRAATAAVAGRNRCCCGPQPLLLRAATAAVAGRNRCCCGPQPLLLRAAIAASRAPPSAIIGLCGTEPTRPQKISFGRFHTKGFFCFFEAVGPSKELF